MILTYLTASLLSHAQRNGPTVVETFINSLVEGNLSVTRAMIKGANRPLQETPAVRAIRTYLLGPGRIPIWFETATPGTKKGKAGFVLQTKFNSVLETEWVETATIGAKALLVPPQSVDQNTGMIGKILIALAGDPSGLLKNWPSQLKSEAEDRDIMKSLKNVGVAVSIYQSENKDLMPGKEWRTALSQYMTSPVNPKIKKGSKTASLSFNPKLFKLNQLKVREIDKTLMLYVGVAEKPEFIFGGRCMVCTANGEVLKLTPTELKNYRWNP